MKFDDFLAMQTKSRQPRKDEEHKLQCSMVNWFRFTYPQYAHCLFAVPNGGRRDAVTGAKMKAEGVLAGVSDMILLLRTKDYGALLIEVKTPKGKQSPSQKLWQSKMEALGYKYIVVRTVSDFIREVKNYLIDVILNEYESR